MSMSLCFVVLLGMTLILLLSPSSLVHARLGDHHDSDSNQNSKKHSRFSALQPATLMQGASPPADIDRMLMCTVDEHCAGHNEQCIAGSCECPPGFQRLSSKHCTKTADDFLSNS